MTKNVVILQEGGDPVGTRLPNAFVFKKLYWRYCILTQEFDGYVTDIL